MFTFYSISLYFYRLYTFKHLKHKNSSFLKFEVRHKILKEISVFKLVMECRNVKDSKSYVIFIPFSFKFTFRIY
jgi:hypothetical protein